jgi:hypothetical protein
MDEGKAKRVIKGAAAVAMAVHVEVDTEHEEVDKVAILGLPVFFREPSSGNPRVLGIPFPRWIRGPRS